MTVAVRHQYGMCVNLLEPPGINKKFLYNGDIIGKGMIVSINMAFELYNNCFCC